GARGGGERRHGEQQAPHQRGPRRARRTHPGTRHARQGRAGAAGRPDPRGVQSFSGRAALARRRGGGVPSAAVLRLLGTALGVLLVAGVALLLYAWLRPNRAAIDPRLALEHWDAVSDGEHNSNTDMIEWRGDFLLVHDARPYHL